MSTQDKSLKEPGRTLVWDWPIRLFHWALLISVVVSWVAVDILDDTELHMQSGQVVLGLLAFRVAWGFVGPRSARFTQFIRGPRTVLQYLRGQPVSYVGHNPLGALSVVALLASLLVQVLTGLASDDEIFSSGPLAKHLPAEWVEYAHSIHHLNWDILTVLVLLHIAAIIFYAVHGKNLVRPMITGYNSNHDNEAAGIQNRPFWLPVVIAALAAVLAWWVFTL